MLGSPKKVVNAVNNRVTVALPITSIDVQQLAGQLNLRLTDLVDVDMESGESAGREDGVMLQWHADTQTWSSTKNITERNKKILDGGWRE